MIRKRIYLAIALLLPAIAAAQVFGIPRRVFDFVVTNSLTVEGTTNIGALTTTGTIGVDLDTDASATGIYTDNDNTGTSALNRIYVQSDDTQIAMFAAGSNVASPIITNGQSGNVAAIRTLGADAIEFGTANTLRMSLFGDSTGLVMYDQLVSTIASSQLDNAGFQINSDAPFLQFYESDGAADQKAWMLGVSGGFRIYSRDDDGTFQGTEMVLDNDGTFNINGEDMTPSEGSVNLTFPTGCTTTPTFPADYQKVGRLVTISWSNTSCTSNSTSFVSTTGIIPSALRPSSDVVADIGMCIDNGTRSWCEIMIDSAGTMTILWESLGNNFTASGSKGMVDNSISYVLP